jgi:hypothetical protein
VYLPMLMVTLLLIAGCRSEGVADEPTPALLKDPDAQTRAELRRTVSAALGGAAVTLADDALTGTSLLVIERRRHVDAQGRRIMGRDLGTSDRFMLFLQDGRCYLEHLGQEQRWPLPAAECVAAPGEGNEAR